MTIPYEASTLLAASICFGGAIFLLFFSATYAALLARRHFRIKKSRERYAVVMDEARTNYIAGYVVRHVSVQPTSALVWPFNLQ